MPLYIAKSGDLDRCYRCLTDRLTDSQSKDSATQLLTKYKSGALVTQFQLTVTIKSLLIRLFMVLASFSLCHFCTLEWVLNIFIVNHLNPCLFSLIYLSFLVSYSSCSHFSCAVQHQHICLDCIFVFYVGCSYFFLLVLSLLFLCVFLSFLIFSLFLAMCNISRWENAFELYLCLLCFEFLFFSPYKLVILMSF